jgi:hypothetical protein
MTVSPSPLGFNVCCQDPHHDAQLPTEAEAVDHALGQLACLRAFAIRHVDRLANGCLSIWCEEAGLDQRGMLVYT